MPGKKLAGSGPSVTVTVKQENIDRAERRDSSHCMIADTIKQVLPEASNVSVDLATIRWTDRKLKRRYVYLTPPLAQRSLVNFDQGIPTEPFSFRLHKAVQVVESGKTGSRAKRGVATAHGENASGVPVVHGGVEPPLGALASGTGAKAQATKARKATEKAAVEVPVDAEGHPIPGAPNPALTNSNKGRIRAFGLRQLKP
jgi:hypothetical protein